MLTWDIDRYEQLQDAAWELDARATVQDASAKRHGGTSSGDADRATASGKRDEAALLLARYWVLPLPTPRWTPTRTLLGDGPPARSGPREHPGESSVAPWRR
jgi:hypothetical protein